jgi:hypothetical protein
MELINNLTAFFLINKSKKGKLKIDLFSAIAITLTLLVVIMSFFSDAIPIAQSAAANITNEGRCGDVGCNWNSTSNQCIMNSSGTNVTCDYNEIPLGELFGRSSFIFMIILAALLIMIMKAILFPKKIK